MHVRQTPLRSNCQGSQQISHKNYYSYKIITAEDRNIGFSLRILSSLVQGRRVKQRFNVHHTQLKASLCLCKTNRLHPCQDQDSPLQNVGYVIYKLASWWSMCMLPTRTARGRRPRVEAHCREPRSQTERSSTQLGFRGEEMKFSPSGTRALGTRARLWERRRRWEQGGRTETPGTARERHWRWGEAREHIGNQTRT